MGYYQAGGYYAAGGIGATAAKYGRKAYKAVKGAIAGTPMEYLTGSTEVAADTGGSGGGGGGGGRAYRHQNVANVRALRRAMRRLSGFEKLAHRVLTFTKHHAPGKAHFKFKRRAKRC